MTVLLVMLPLEPTLDSNGRSCRLYKKNPAWKPAILFGIPVISYSRQS
ncbi:MAG: hypothetical protein ABI402_05285 [Ferruginibacter sp.]